MLLILGLASLLRLWNYDFETRAYTYETDRKLREAEEVALGHYKPRRWRQPYFLVYSSGFLLASFSDSLSLKPDKERKISSRKILTAYMIALSIGTVLALYFLALSAYHDDRVALLSALVLAVIPVSVAGARFIKEDIPLMFWCTCALLAMMELLNKAKPAYYLAASALIGYAIATKYSGLILLPVFLVAHLLFVSRHDRKWSALFSWQFLVSPLLIVVVFLLVNPYSLVYLERSVEGFLSQLGFARIGGGVEDTIPPRTFWWTYYLRYVIPQGTSWLLTLCFVVGFVLSLKSSRRSPTRIVLCAWVGLYYLTFELASGKAQVFPARYLHPLFPALCCLAAYSLVFLYQKLASRSITRLFAVGVLGVAVIVPATRSILVVKGAVPDTRNIARRWLEEHMPARSHFRSVDWPYSPMVDNRRFRQSRIQSVWDVSPERLRKGNVDFIAVSSFDYQALRDLAPHLRRPRDEYEMYQTLFAGCPMLEEVKPRLPAYTYAYHNPVIRILNVRTCRDRLVDPRDLD